MNQRTKKLGKRLLSLLLTLALTFTLVPTVALAEDAELIKFKNMHMLVLRNGMTVANYDYASKQNDLEHSIALALDGSWVKLDFVISYSQDVSLKLYRMSEEAGEQDWQNDNPLFLESYVDASAPPDYGANQDEEFLGEFLGYLNGVRVTDNLTPVDETADFVEYQRIDEESWNKIVWNAVDREAGDRSGCTTMKDIYAFGFEGESYAHYKAEKDAASGASANQPAKIPAKIEDAEENFDQQPDHEESNAGFGELIPPVEAVSGDDTPVNPEEGQESINKDIVESDGAEEGVDTITAPEERIEDEETSSNPVGDDANIPVEDLEPTSIVSTEPEVLLNEGFFDEIPAEISGEGLEELPSETPEEPPVELPEIGRASCRERV